MRMNSGPSGVAYDTRSLSSHTGVTTFTVPSSCTVSSGTSSRAVLNNMVGSSTSAQSTAYPATR